MSQFRDRRAIVTGASSGIGRATALALAEAGAVVVGLGRNKGALDSLARESKGRVTPMAGELVDAKERHNVMERAQTQLRGLDVLVNSAGRIEMGSILDTDLDAFDRTMDLNVRALYDITRLALPELIKAHGNIVNVSSVAGPRAFPGVMAYCVSKAAVDQMTRCAALELADKGVRVNAVNPGVVLTNLHRRSGMSEQQYQQFLERSAATHPLGRPGKAEEIAGLICFLASDAASWITGATYSIDGGRGQTCMR